MPCSREASSQPASGIPIQRRTPTWLRQHSQAIKASTFQAGSLSRGAPQNCTPTGARKLSLGWPNLSLCQSSASRALNLEHIKPRLARPLGHDAGAEFHLVISTAHQKNMISTSFMSPARDTADRDSLLTPISRAPTAKSSAYFPNRDGMRGLLQTQFSFRRKSRAT